MLNRFGIVGIAMLAFAISLAEAPMAFGKTLVLASQVNGQLVDEGGAPQPGIKIVREWRWVWNDKTGADETTTDNDGRFSLPEVTETSFWAGLTPHEPKIDTTVTAQAPSGSVLLFEVSKRDYAPDAELADRGLTGPGINVTCRIDKKPDGKGPFWGTCLPAQ